MMNVKTYVTSTGQSDNTSYKTWRSKLGQDVKSICYTIICSTPTTISVPFNVFIIYLICLSNKLLYKLSTWAVANDNYCICIVCCGLNFRGQSAYSQTRHPTFPLRRSSFHKISVVESLVPSIAVSMIVLRLRKELLPVLGMITSNIYRNSILR